MEGQAQRVYQTHRALANHVGLEQRDMRNNDSISPSGETSNLSIARFLAAVLSVR